MLSPIAASDWTTFAETVTSTAVPLLVGTIETTFPFSSTSPVNKWFFPKVEVELKKQAILNDIQGRFAIFWLDLWFNGFARGDGDQVVTLKGNHFARHDLTFGQWRVGLRDEH